MKTAVLISKREYKLLPLIHRRNKHVSSYLIILSKAFASYESIKRHLCEQVGEISKLKLFAQEIDYPAAWPDETFI